MPAHPSEPKPRDMAAYAEAKARGIVPVVPASPPALLPGPTARTLMNQFIVTGVSAFVVAFIVIAAARAPWVKGAASGVAVVVAIALYIRAGRRNLHEILHGYTTVELTFGGSWGLPMLRPVAASQKPVAWNYDGIWVLNGRGDVVSAPNPAVDPPGYFPSPSRPGQLEFWTGAVWTRDYRRESVSR